MYDDERKVSEELRRHQLQSSTPEEQAEVWDTVANTPHSSTTIADPKNPATQRQPILRWIMTVAAVASVAIGLAMAGKIWKTSAPTNSDPIIANEIRTQDLVKDLVYVYSLQPEKQQAWVQSMQSFDYLYKHIGETINGKELAGIEDNALILKTESGGIDIVLPSVVNAVSLQALADETAALHELFQNHHMTSRNLTRLGHIASFGVSNAVILLEDIANSSSELSTDAENELTSNKGFSSLGTLVQRSISGEKRYRMQAINTLCQVQAPLAASCLQTLTEDSSPDIAAFVVTMVAKQNTTQSYRILSHAAQAAIDPDVRVSAQQQLDKLAAAQQ